MTKLLSGIHRKNLSFTQEKVMSWLKVDQEPDLGHIKRAANEQSNGDDR